MYEVYAVVKIHEGRMSQGHVFAELKVAQDWIDLQEDKNTLSVLPLTVLHRLYEATGEQAVDLQRSGIEKLTPYERDALGFHSIPSVDD